MAPTNQSNFERDLGRLQEATETLKQSVNQLEQMLQDGVRSQSHQISKIFSSLTQINSKVSAMDNNLSSIKSLSDRVKKLEDNLLFLRGNGRGIAAVLSLLVLVGAGIYHVVDMILQYVKVVHT